MQQFVHDLVIVINEFLWAKILIALLITCGLYFTIGSKFVQFSMFKEMFVVLRGSTEKSKDGISAFQAFCISMAARVGTGNITGVAIAISLGGPGAVFGCGLSRSSAQLQALLKAH